MTIFWLNFLEMNRFRFSLGNTEEMTAALNDVFHSLKDGSTVGSIPYLYCLWKQE
jgi:hypothetical protein